jgi:competence protein ComEC
LPTSTALVERRLEVEAPVAILKVAHHGSRSSSGEAFLSRVRPRNAVISCGRRNAFGHPHPASLARLLASGARIERTDHEGARWFEVDDRGVRVVEWRAHDVLGGVSSAAMNAVGRVGPKP